MSTKRYTQEFKVEAVGQVVEKGYRVADVAARLGVSQHSLYEWIKERRLPVAERQAQVVQSEEVRRLKTELRRVTEERDILQKAAACFAKQSG
jgi:transposase